MNKSIMRLIELLESLGGTGFPSFSWLHATADGPIKPEDIGKDPVKCLIIGGAVIDNIMEREVKDWDIEVYGLRYDDMVQALRDNDLPADLVGKQFGIVKTTIDGIDVDLSVPRRDNNIGTSHKDVKCLLDPRMTPEEAGRRRDLTINSMYQDPHTMEITDPWGGLSDLEAGIIRATDPETYPEDPLRPLRAMQLLARKGRVVDDDTLCLCHDMQDMYDMLPADRVFGEFKKLLMLADKPSVGLEFLNECGWIKHFPELEALTECPHNPKHHPEGDAWEHTLLVVDAAAQLKHRLPEEWQLPYMFGALCHDMGKPDTTTVCLNATGHDMAGGPHAEVFMRRLTNEKKLIQRVRTITEAHMRPFSLFSGNAKANKWKKLHNVIRLDVICMMSRADGCVTRQKDVLNAEHGPSALGLKYFEEFGEKKIEQVLQGRNLIDRGMKPGPEFGRIIKRAYEIQIEESIDDVDELFQRASEEV